VGPRAGLDEVVREKNSHPLLGLEPRMIQPVAGKLEINTTFLSGNLKEEVS
jgi:hypothetical protein